MWVENNKHWFLHFLVFITINNFSKLPEIIFLHDPENLLAQKTTILDQKIDILYGTKLKIKQTYFIDLL